MTNLIAGRGLPRCFARRGARLLAAALLFAGSSLVAAVEPTAAPASNPGVVEDQLLDEVVVRGTRLWKMRENLTRIEDRFYALYDELNKNDDFDVHCTMEARLGTRLRKHVCRVAFFENARTEEARGLLAGDRVPPAAVVMLEREDEYRKNALQVINSDQRLLKLVHERETLERKYNEELRRRYKGR